jgi:hypothetical protein
LLGKRRRSFGRRGDTNSGFDFFKDLARLKKKLTFIIRAAVHKCADSKVDEDIEAIFFKLIKSFGFFVTSLNHKNNH